MVTENFTHFTDEELIEEDMNKIVRWVHPEFDLMGWAYPNERKGSISRYKYGWRCQHWANLKLGKNTDIGCFTYMNALYGIEIGDNTQIGSHCSIYSINTENNTKGKVIIGKNCLIGSHCLILPNTVIPDNTKVHAYRILKENKKTTFKEGWEHY